MKRRLGLLAAALTLGALAPGCLGPNRAFHGLHDWNRDLSDTDVVNELVFLGLHIVPVYGLAYALDVIVLNTVEYWTGDNPMNGDDMDG